MNAAAAVKLRIFSSSGKSAGSSAVSRRNDPVYGEQQVQVVQCSMLCTPLFSSKKILAAASDSRYTGVPSVPVEAEIQSGVNSSAKYAARFSSTV